MERFIPSHEYFQSALHFLDSPKKHFANLYVYVHISRIDGRAIASRRNNKFFKFITVSFYGASYIHLPVQEAKGATDISFRFRTHLADAMLLLAVGRTDYCLIKLETGKLKVRLPSMLTSINRLSVWFFVAVGR